MSFNPLTEIKYRYRLAVENLERAERLLSLRDWVGAVSASQLAIENFAKAVIAVFEVPTWSHDPSNQLGRLIERLPGDVAGDLNKKREIIGVEVLGPAPIDVASFSHPVKIVTKKAGLSKG